jgi:hypothetical protein
MFFCTMSPMAAEATTAVAKKKGLSPNEISLLVQLTLNKSTFAVVDGEKMFWNRWCRTANGCVAQDVVASPHVRAGIFLRVLLAGNASHSQADLSAALNDRYQQQQRVFIICVVLRSVLAPTYQIAEDAEALGMPRHLDCRLLPCPYKAIHSSNTRKLTQQLQLRANILDAGAIGPIEHLQRAGDVSNSRPTAPNVSKGKPALKIALMSARVSDR